MPKRILVLICSIVLIVPLLFMGCGSDGSDGAKGAPGTNAPSTGNIAGIVTDNTALNGIQGVTVTAKDSGGAVKGTATTDATGAYTLANLPLGTVTVYFAKTPQYTSPNGMTVGVLGGQTVTINAALGESKDGAPSVSIAGYNNGMYTTDDFGYGGTAALAASGSDPNGDTLTYTWSNTTAPVLGSVSGSGTTATVTFPTLAQAMATRAVPADNGTISGYAYTNKSIGRFGILPILPDTRGAVTTTVKVADGRGQTASVSLTLNAASVLTGARNVPRGARVYMNRGNDNALQTWAITKPTGSAAVLDNTSSRTPSFLADVSGQYTLSVAALSKTITINAGTWVGVIDAAGATATGYTFGQEGSCVTCHNGSIAVNEFDDWYATAHSKIFTLGVTGGSGTSGTGCLTCHTVGFDRGTNNGGFDDLASSTGWVFPTRNATAWTSMVANYPTVAKLANIQCENCHGPQQSAGHMSTGPLGAIDNNNTFASARISYSAELCATCHASGTGHNLYSQWASSGHANASLATRSTPAAGSTVNSCGRCHSAQGFTIYADQLKEGNIGYIDIATSPQYFSSIDNDNVQPQTCTACHDPHDATNPNQLRLYNDITLLPSGFGVKNFGKGAICTACHNTRNGVYMDSAGNVTSTTTAFLHEDGQVNGTPFAITGHDHTQADVLAGRNAYFMGSSLPMISKHAAVEDTCVGCHMALNPRSHNSHGTPTPDTHRFGLDFTKVGSGGIDLPTYCGNCHGKASVNGEAIQAATQAGLDSANASMAAALLKFLQSGVDNIVIVGQYYDNGTRVGASTSSVTINTAGTNITNVRRTSGATFEFTIAGLAYKVRATLFQGSATANPVMSVRWNGGANGFDTSSNIFKACWNVTMITYDYSLGIHNPTFVQQVLNNTKWNLDQYGVLLSP